MDRVILGKGSFQIQSVIKLMRQNSSSYADLLKRWEPLGYSLDIDDATVVSLKEKQTREALQLGEMPREIFRVWKSENGSSATLKVLHDALVDIGVKDLAELIKDKFCLETKPSVLFNLQGTTLELSEIFEMPCTNSSYKRVQTLLKSGGSEHLNPIDLLNSKILTPEQPKYYIPRTLSFRQKVKEEIFKRKQTESHVFLIKGVSMHELGLIAGVGEVTDLSGNQIKEVTCRFILLQHDDDFVRICKKTKKPVHALEFKDGCYYWIKSSSKLDVVIKYLENEACKYSETGMITKVIESPRPSSFCLADSPGMGKTLLLANLATKIKQCNQNIVTFFIVLQEFVQNVTEVKSSSKALEIVAEYATTNEINKLVLLELLHRGEYQFDMFFDGYDEIKATKVKLVDNFLKHLKNSPGKNIYITTRPHLKSQLINVVMVNSYEILPFDESSQIDFLTKYWVDQREAVNNIQLKKFAKECLSALQEKMTDDEREIAGIPLQCRMLAEVYAEDATRSSKLEQGTGFTVKVSTIFDMYRELVSLKFKRVKKYRKVTEGNFMKFKSLRKNYIHAHIYEAIQLLFPDWTERLEKHLLLRKEADENRMYSIGLIEKSPVSNTKRFIHRTFAEYLLAQFLVQNLSKCRECMEIVFRVILCNASIQTKKSSDGPTYYKLDYPVIAYFIDRHLKLYQESNHIDDELILLFLNHKNLINENKENLCMTIAACCCYDLESCFDLARKVFFGFDFQNEEWEKLKDTHLKYLPHLTITNSNNLFLLKKILIMMKIAFDVKLDYFVFNPTMTKSRNMSKVQSYVVDQYTYPWIPNCTPLHVALYNGNYGIVKHLVEQYEDQLKSMKNLIHVCVRDSDRNNALTIDSKKSILSMLLDKSSEHKINWLGEQFESTDVMPILQKNVHVELLEILVRHGADINARSKEFKNVLRRQDEFENYKRVICWAIRNGLNISKTKGIAGEINFAMEKFKRIDNEFLTIMNEKETAILAKDGSQSSYLIHLCSYKICNKCLVRKIIESGAKINHIDGDNQTVMHAIISNASKQNYNADELLGTLNLLVERNFHNINLADKDGNTPLILLALQFKNLNINLIVFFYTHGLEFSRRNKDGQSALLAALENTNDTDLIDKMIECGADVNCMDKYNNTAMHIAIEYASLSENKCTLNDLRKLFDLLIAKGFNKLNVPNILGYTPLLQVIKVIYVDATMIDFFHENGFDFTLTDNAGNSVLFEGIRCSQSVETINKIIEYGSNIYHRNNSGQSALHIATKYVHYDALSLLNILDVNSTDKDGNTALHYIP